MNVCQQRYYKDYNKDVDGETIDFYTKKCVETKTT
jgi:hypothetical protein